MRGKTRIAKIAFPLFDDFMVIQNNRFDEVILIIDTYRIHFSWRDALACESKLIYKQLHSFKRLYKV